VTVIVFILAAGLIATALNIPNFLQVGLATEPPNGNVVDTGAKRSGTWRHYEQVW